MSKNDDYGPFYGDGTDEDLKATIRGDEAHARAITEAFKNMLAVFLCARPEKKLPNKERRIND